MNTEKVLGIILAALSALAWVIYDNSIHIGTTDATLSSHVKESKSDRDEIRKRLFDHLLGK